MAYRQLCAVTFAVIGWALVGCGGNTSTGTTTSVAGDQQPPGSSDQPPSASDQAPSSSDQAPPSADAPPASADTPAGSGTGGRLTELCQDFCSAIAGAVDRCSNGLGGMGLGNVCSKAADCQVPANVPCQDEIIKSFDCVLDNLQGLCVMTSSGDPPQDQGDAPAPQTAAVPCQTETKAMTACIEKNLPPDQVSDPNPGQGQNCTLAGGCKQCPSACATCGCQAGTDLTKLAACGMSDACAMP